MGTLCQPGEVTSGERQPKKHTAQQRLISIQHTDIMMERKAKQSKREQKGGIKGEMCEGTGLEMQQANSARLCRSHHFIGPHFTGLDKSPVLQPIIAATVTESTYFFMFLTFMLAVLTQERRRGSAGCSVISSLLTWQTERADINTCQSVSQSQGNWRGRE